MLPAARAASVWASIGLSGMGDASQEHGGDGANLERPPLPSRLSLARSWWSFERGAHRRKWAACLLNSLKRVEEFTFLRFDPLPYWMRGLFLGALLSIERGE